MTIISVKSTHNIESMKMSNEKQLQIKFIENPPMALEIKKILRMKIDYNKKLFKNDKRRNNLIYFVRFTNMVKAYIKAKKIWEIRLGKKLIKSLEYF